MRAYNEGMERTIVLNGIKLSYTLERKRVKNVNLRVRGGEIFVSAPRWVSAATVEALLRERADFILGALERTEKTSLSCEDGAALPYRGGTLTLRLERGGKNALRIEGALLRAALRDPSDPESVRRALEGWYRAESERLCRDRLDALWPQFAAMGVPRPQMRMRSMRSAWGVCHPKKGYVTFNALLAAVPDVCLEYVVAHELTHFLHADHSPAFYAALAHVIPDWKKRRGTLRPYGALLGG